jgi:hypothetical protein
LFHEIDVAQLQIVAAAAVEEEEEDPSSTCGGCEEEEEEGKMEWSPTHAATTTWEFQQQQ